jgi:hypothetical protein
VKYADRFDELAADGWKKGAALLKVADENSVSDKTVSRAVDWVKLGKPGPTVRRQRQGRQKPPNNR